MSLSHIGAACYADCKLAFALLTRFGRGKIVADTDMSGAMASFATVGLIIGLFFTFPVYFFATIFPVPVSPWLLAWCYVLADAYVTRAMHFDAVADIGDAVGSQSPAHFWEIIYDSRMGAFGAVALFVALSGLLLGAQDTIASENWLVLIFAPAFGRMLVVLFACISPARDPNSLGGKTCAGKSPILFLVYVILIGLLLWPFEFAPVMGILLTSTLFVVMMWRLARANGGCNGDFLGTVIVGGQIIFLFFL